MIEHKGDIYISAVVINNGYRGVRTKEDLLNPDIKALIAVYADLHGERVINRRPLKMTIEGDAVLITDSKDRQWAALGYATGDPHNPTLVTWAEAMGIPW